MSKYDKLKSMGRKLADKPEIGGFVAVGVVSNYHDSYHVFLGLYDTKQQAQVAAGLHGTLSLREAEDKAEAAAEVSHGAEVMPVTKKLAAAIKSGKEDKGLLSAPEWIGYDSVKIDGQDVAATHTEANSLAFLLRESVQLMRSRRLSPVELLKAAFTAAAAETSRRGKKLIAFIRQAAAKALPQATRPAKPGPARPRGPALRL